MATKPSAVAPLALFVALTACNSIVLPSVGGDKDDTPSYNKGPTGGYYPPAGSPAAATCNLPDRVTASGELVSEATDAGPPIDGGAVMDSGDGGEEPPPDPSVSAYYIRVAFSTRGGAGFSFGRAPTCVGCEVRSVLFNASGGTIVILIPPTDGSTSAFAAAAISVPFRCGDGEAVVTLKVLHKPGDSTVTVDGYATY